MDQQIEGAGRFCEVRLDRICGELEEGDNRNLN